MNAAEAVMGWIAKRSRPVKPLLPSRKPTMRPKTVIDELAEEQKNEPGIVGMQPISHAEGQGSCQ